MSKIKSTSSITEPYSCKSQIDCHGIGKCHKLSCIVLFNKPPNCNNCTWSYQLKNLAERSEVREKKNVNCHNNSLIAQFKSFFAQKKMSICSFKANKSLWKIRHIPDPKNTFIL